MSKNYAAGKPAEDFYYQIVGPADFPGQPIEDVRGKHTEGDFAIGKKGRLFVEVKGDYVCFRKNGRPTGNLPIEIKNTANPDGEGWFFHCHVDNVDEVVFVCYDGINKAEPVCSIRIPFVWLEEYVTAKLKDANYVKRHYLNAYNKDEETGKTEIARNLCVPLKELYDHCGATVATARAKNQDLQALAQDALDKLGIDGKLGEYTHISFSRDERIGGLLR